VQNQNDWIIFEEGFRGGRIEMSIFDISDYVSGNHIIWNGNLKLNNHSKFYNCDQFYINNGVWEKFITNYPVMSDYALKIIASSLDVYDKDGKLIVNKTPPFPFLPLPKIFPRHVD
jgi:hypothetical protein